MTDQRGSWIRGLLRKAEGAFSREVAETEPAGGGIRLGPPQHISGDELRALLAAAPPARPSLTVIVHFDDTPVKDRAAIEAPLAGLVEREGLGSWQGSGQGRVGDDAFFDVAFSVDSIEAAVPHLRRELKVLGAGSRTRILGSDGSEHDLG